MPQYFFYHQMIYFHCMKNKTISSDLPYWYSSWQVEFYCDRQRSQTELPWVWLPDQTPHYLRTGLQTKYPSDKTERYIYLACIWFKHHQNIIYIPSNIANSQKFQRIICESSETKILMSVWNKLGYLKNDHDPLLAIILGLKLYRICYEVLIHNHYSIGTMKKHIINATNIS